MKVENKSNVPKKIRAVIDTETTHLDETKGALIELGIMPVDDKFQPLKDIEPFHVIIKPNGDVIQDPVAMDINGIKFHKVSWNTKKGALRKLYEWKKSNNIKAIYPIGQNWEFDSRFYKAFAKDTCLENLFYHRASDTQRLAQSINDAHLARGLTPLFQKTKLEVLAGFFGIDYSKAHRALEDCEITRQVYIELLSYLKVFDKCDICHEDKPIEGEGM